MTSLMGLWTEVRAHLEWIRDYNGSAARPVSFYGIDLSGSNSSLLPSLDAVAAFLAEADPERELDPLIRETAARFAAASPFSIASVATSYGNLAPERQDALTAALARLTHRLTGHRLEYVRRTSAEAYEHALRAIHLAAVLDVNAQAMLGQDLQAVLANRDAAIADNVEWILRRQDRILLAAHNGHVQRWPTVAAPGRPPASSMGMHLADRLGKDYVVIGMTTGGGLTFNLGPGFFKGELLAEQGPPEPDSLDALMDASCDRPFAVDLRQLSPEDTAAVGAIRRHRHGIYYPEVDPLDAFDLIVHFPETTAAHLDHGAVASSPPEVRRPSNRACESGRAEPDGSCGNEE